MVFGVAVWCALFVVCCLLFGGCCSLCAVCCSLFGGNCWLVVAYCVLLDAARCAMLLCKMICCSLFVVCSWSSSLAVRCLPFVVCCAFCDV